MQLGSNENFVTLYFPFGYNSQEKYGITSSATSKSGVAKGGEKRERGRERAGGAFLLLLCTPLPFLSRWQPTCSSLRPVASARPLTLIIVWN